MNNAPKFGVLLALLMASPMPKAIAAPLDSTDERSNHEIHPEQNVDIQHSEELDEATALSLNTESFAVSPQPLFSALDDTVEEYREVTVIVPSGADVRATDLSLTLEGRSPSSEVSSPSQELLMVEAVSEPVLDADGLQSSETIESLPPVLEASDASDIDTSTDTSDDPEAIDSAVSDAGLLTAQSEDMEVSTSDNWHFLLQPYIYAPFNVDGDVTARGVTADVDLGLDDVLDSLNWGLFGRIEGFSPDYHFGLLIDAAYVSTSSNSSTAFPVGEILDGRVRAELADRLPQAIEARLPDIANRIFPDGVPDTINPEDLPLDDLRAAAQERVTQLRDRLNERIPDEFTVDADANLDIGKFDFGIAYRFYDESEVNPDGVESEFDLGPIVFDVIAGVRIYTFDISIDLDSNIPGVGDRNLDQNKTIVEPLIGAALRFNLSPTVAIGARADVSGFGWDDMTLSWAMLGGVDWMFSGNTSLALGYRVSQLVYDQGNEEDTTSIDLTQHGPYLGVSFRF